MHNTNKEVWRTIYNGYYAISTFGRIKRLKRGRSVLPGRMLNPYTMNNGYKAVKLYLDKCSMTKLLHQIVAETFIGPVPIEYMLDGDELVQILFEVDHKNTNKLDCRLINLRYLPASINASHKGETNGFSKLNDTKVRKIRILSARGRTNRGIGKRFNVNEVTISYILSRKTWSHVL